MKMLFLALIAVYVWAPSVAMADPVTAAITTFLVSAGATATFAATVATFVTQTLIGVAFSLVGQLFSEKPKGIKPQGIQTKQTTTGDTIPQKFVVGRYAVEPHANAPAYSRNGSGNEAKNRILNYMLMEVSNLPVKGLTGRVIIDGEYQTLVEGANDASRFDFQEIGFDEAGNPLGSMWFFDGTQTTAFAGNVNFGYDNDPDRPLTTNHILKGSAYCNFEFAFNREIYTGLPSVRVEIDGVSLYDPRKDTTVGGSGAHRWDDPDTWEFTQNPQVINYNILRGITLPTGDIYGGEVPPEDLPLDNWFAAMNECDVLIGDRPQFQAGFEIDTGEMEPAEVIKEMNRASFAQVSEFGGVFRVRVGAPAAPVMTLTDDDFLITEPSSYDPFPGLANTYNAVTGTYVEPADVWESRSVPAITNSDWEAEDGGRRLTINIDLPAVSNASQAKQLMNSYINDQRRFRTHRMVLPPSFALLEPLDSIEWTSDLNGYTAKVFEVLEVEHRADTLNQSVFVRERDAGDVAWTPEQDIDPPSPFLSLTPPTVYIPDITVTAVTLDDGDGAARKPAIKLEWIVQVPDSIPQLEYEQRLLGDVTGPVNSAVVGQASGETIISAGIINDQNYEVRARFITDLPTDWSAWSPVRTSDTRLTAKDIVNALTDKIDTAFERHDQALDSLEPGGSVAQLLNEVRINDAIFAARNVSDLAQNVVAFEESGDNAAAIVTEQTARADADSAIASDVTALTSRVDGNESNITALQITKVTASGAIAAVETEISATYGSLTAQASATSFAEATADAIEAGYVWRLNGSNVLEAVSVQDGVDTGPTSTFRIAADFVQITGLTQIDQAVINNLAADNGFISNLTVDTVNIAGNAVAAQAVSTRATDLAGSGAFATDVMSGSIDIPEGVAYTVMLVVSFAHAYSSGQKDWGFKVWDDSGLGLIFARDTPKMVFGNDYPTVSILVDLPAEASPKTRSYAVDWYGEDSTLELLTDSTLSILGFWT